MPPHLARQEAPPDDPGPAVPDGPPDASGPVTVAAAAALALGIAIGLITPPLLRTATAAVGQAPPAPPAVVAMTEPPAAPAAYSLPQPEPTIEAAPPPVPAAPPAKPAAGSAPLRAALALLSPLPMAPPKPDRRPSADAACPAAASRADQEVCADPGLAAADREMKRAYQRASAAGAKPDALWSGQIAWLLAREEAAARSPADLAAAYRGRTAELNALAAEPPH